MDIVISSYEKDPSLIFKNVRDYFSQEFPTEEFEWKCSGAGLTISLLMGHPEEAKRLFFDLGFVVIDEIHAYKSVAWNIFGSSIV